MSAAVNVQPARRAPWVLTARWQFHAELGAFLWLWGIVVVALGIAYVGARGLLEFSIAQFARHGALWMGFVTAILLVTTYTTMHVASGLTRRSFVRASLLNAVLFGLLSALIAALLLEIESVVYAAYDWPHTGVADFDPAAGFGVILPAFALSFIAGRLSGLLVGMAYYRFGGWRGTVLLPLTIAPIFLVGSDTLPTGQFQLLGFLGLPAAATFLVGLLVLALAAAAYHLIARDVPIRKAGLL